LRQNLCKNPITEADILQCIGSITAKRGTENFRTLLFTLIDY
jgi:hypothetical protein